jgi:hypothetical protein
VQTAARLCLNLVLGSSVSLALSFALPARAQTAGPSNDPDADALSLTSAPVEPAQGPSSTRFFVEGVAGRADQRSPEGWRNIGRLSADFSGSFKLGESWRAVLSDRLDSVHPADIGAENTVNSLREAYVSWQPKGGSTVVDLGRVNLRYGPAYGYNPTDFFRDNTLRTITTVNPLALRERRLGTFVLRGQRLFGDSAVSLAYAPKLDSGGPSTDGWSADVGATNNRDRGLLTFSTRFSDRINSQFLLYKESSLPAQLGASTTALVTDSTVVYAEWSRGREPDLLTRTMGLAQPQRSRNRFAGGLTFTPWPALSITGEYQYNGFALDKNGWQTLTAGGLQAMGGYLIEAQRRQEIASREAWLVYATLKDAAMKNLDITALLRRNSNDGSRLQWLEVRYHWPRIDVALQLQQQSGSQVTEFGLTPYRRSAQLLAAYYFQ